MPVSEGLQVGAKTGNHLHLSHRNNSYINCVILAQSNVYTLLNLFNIYSLNRILCELPEQRQRNDLLVETEIDREKKQSRNKNKTPTNYSSCATRSMF